MNVETGSKVSLPACPGTTSIEPRSYERGNQKEIRKLKDSLLTSIEPRSYERGNQNEKYLKHGWLR